MVAFALPRVQPGLIAPAALTPLPGVPFFLLLLLISRPWTLLFLSEKQRYLDWTLVLIRSAGFIVSIAEIWRKGLHGAANRISESGNFWLSLSQSSTRFLISDVFALLSGFGFLLFLVALAQQVKPPLGFGEGRPRMIRNLALFATMMSGLALILVATSQYEMMHYRGRLTNPPNAVSIMRSALFGLPGLLAPLIVWSSVRRSGCRA